MPTGGVSPTKENLTEWFKAGVTCVGMGSKLMNKNNNGDYDYKGIKNLVMNTIEIIKNLK